MVIDLFGPGGSLLTFFQCYRWTPKPDLRSPSFLLIPKYHKYTCFESIKIFGNFLIVLLYFYVYLAKFSSRSIGGKDFLHYFCKICVSMSPLSMVHHAVISDNKFILYHSCNTDLINLPRLQTRSILQGRR